MKRLTFQLLLAAAGFILGVSTRAEDQYTIDWVHQFGNAYEFFPDPQGFLTPLRAARLTGEGPETDSLSGFALLDREGNLTQRFEVPLVGAPIFVARTSDGGVLAVVSEPYLVTGIPFTRAVAIKYSASFTEERRHTFEDADARGAIADAKGGFWIPLQIHYYKAGRSNARSLAWVDDSVAVVREYPLADGISGQSSGLHAPASGGLYMNERLSGDSQLSQLYVSRISSQGELLWRKPAGYENVSNGCVLGQDGYFVGIGDTRTPTGLVYELFRRDENWNVVWTKSFSFGRFPILKRTYRFTSYDVRGENAREMQVDPLTGDISQLAACALPERETADGSLIDSRGFLYGRHSVPAGTPQILVASWQWALGTGFYPMRAAIKIPDSGVTVRIASSAADAEIFYTEDGTTPDHSSRRYTGEFVCSTDAKKLRAVAFVGPEALLSEPVELINGVEILPQPPSFASVEVGRETALGVNSIYRSNTVARVVAYPRPGWRFSHWAGDSSKTNATVEWVATRPRTFTPIYSTRATVTAPGGHGRVFSFPESELFEEFSDVRFLFVPDPGYVAVWPQPSPPWSGSNPYTYHVIYTNYAATVSFEPVPAGTVGLTVLANGAGKVEISPGKATYLMGDTVQIRAVPDGGANFYGFSGTANSADMTLTLVLNDHQVIFANFSQANSTLIGERPLLQESKVSADQFSFVVANRSQKALRLQQSTDFVNWTDVTGDINAPDHVQSQDFSENTKRLIFRAIVQP